MIAFLDTQRGIATALVLWLISALMILVAALSYGAKTQTRLVQSQLQEARAQALGEGATTVAIKALVQSRKEGREPPVAFHMEITIADQPIQVSIYPANGFINLNTASEDLLLALFTIGADLPENEASILVQRLLDWRDADHIPRPLGAEDADLLASGHIAARDENLLVPEDLRQVLGVSGDIFDRISDLVTTLGSGSAGVNPLGAPKGVLRILTRGDEGLVQSILAAQASGQTDLSADWNLTDVDTSKSNIFLIEAIIDQGNGRQARYRRWVDIGQQAPNGLPWRTLRVLPLQHQSSGA